MDITEVTHYVRVLLETCWNAFQYEIFGVAIWMWLAFFMLMSMTVAFIRGAVLPAFGESFDRERADRIHRERSSEGNRR